MNQSVDAFFHFHEYAEIGHVADNGLVLAAYRIKLCDTRPRILCKLLDTKGHFAIIQVNSKYFRFHFVASDRKRVVSGRSVSLRLDLGGRRLIKNNNVAYVTTIET